MNLLFVSRPRLVPALRWFAVLAALLLVACAPRAERRVEVEQFAASAEFYPRQTGARWRFLPSGESLEGTAVYQTVRGPTMLGGQQYIAWQLSGRGIDRTSYRSYSDQGVFVHREDGPGYVITFDPPLQEMPAAERLNVGTNWQGETTATIHYTRARPEDRFQRMQIRYRYDVVDRRRVSVSAGTFDVFVINLESESIDSEGGRQVLQQEMWFTPFVGEVRNRNNLFLVETNFRMGMSRAN